MTDQDQTVSATFDTEIMNKVNSPATHIEIFYRGQELCFGKTELPIKFGRDEENCHIVVNSNFASRVHCFLEVHDNQIGLTDKSTNGTFIRIGRNDSFVIKNAFYPLIGQGHIQLGREFNNDESDTIYFRMVSKREQR